MLNDYSRSRVPDEATVGGFRIAVVVFGIGVTLPVFFVGSELAAGLGLRDAAFAMASGCALVAALMIVTSVIGAQTRLSTYMIIQFAFGTTGVRCVNLLLAVTYVGYFAATGDIFGNAIREALLAFYDLDVPRPICAAVGCVVMTLTAMYGFKLIERFSLWTVPVLGLFMCYVVYLVVQQTDVQTILAESGVGGISFGMAVSTVIGTNILMAVSGPDLTRYARTEWEGVKSVSGLAVGYPLIMLVSAIPTLVLGETDLMRIMIGLGIAIPALFILVFSTWTTNTVNLYSAVLTLAASFSRVSDQRLAIAASILGTGAAVMGIMDFFLPFVLFIGIAATPIAGVYIADYFIVNRRRYRLRDLAARPRIGYMAITAWFAGSSIAFLANEGYITLSTVPAVDGLAAAFLIYLGLRYGCSTFISHIETKRQNA